MPLINQYNSQHWLTLYWPIHVFNATKGTRQTFFFFSQWKATRVDYERISYYPFFFMETMAEHWRKKKSREQDLVWSLDDHLWIPLDHKPMLTRPAMNCFCLNRVLEAICKDIDLPPFCCFERIMSIHTCSMRLLLSHLITCPSWYEPKNECLSWFICILSCHLLVSSSFMIHTLSVVLHIQPVFCCLSSPTLIYLLPPECVTFHLPFWAYIVWSRQKSRCSPLVLAPLHPTVRIDPQHATAYMTESAVWRWTSWMNKAIASLCSLWNIVPSFFLAQN